MADVFISYSRANQELVAILADAVERAGYSVWWDAELPPHRSYGDVITEEIAEAKAAIVVWSETAAASEWVRAEADMARNQKKLIQASIDDKLPPMPFNQIQFATIGDWRGEDAHPGWRKIQASLASLCGGALAERAPAVPVRKPVPAIEPTTRQRSSLLIPALGVVAVAAVGAGWFALSRPSSAPPPASVPQAAVKPPPVKAASQPGKPEITSPIRYDEAAQSDDPDGYANVRAGPSTGSAIVGRVERGQAFMVARVPGVWWQIRTADGTTGWMGAKFIRVLNGNAASPVAAAPTVVAAPPLASDAGSETFDLPAAISDPRPGFTNIRAAPSVLAPIVARVDRDEPITTFRQEGRWWKVRTRDGSVGWMSRNMIRIAQ